MHETSSERLPSSASSTVCQCIKNKEDNSEAVEVAVVMAKPNMVRPVYDCFKGGFTINQDIELAGFCI